MTRLRFPSLWALLFCACTPRASGTPTPRMDRGEIDTAGLTGLSDLASDGEGGYLSIAERGRALLRLVLGPDGKLRRDGAPIPIEGVSAGQELESLAPLSGGRFLVGTEGPGDRQNDTMLRVRREGNRALVEGKLSVDYSAWGIKATDNHGLEALCAVDKRVAFAAEDYMPGERGAHFAPLGWIDPESGSVTPMKLKLTSPQGRISALACRRAADGSVEAYAIERHYSVRRILRFTLPESAANAPIIPTVIADFTDSVSSKANPEGIAFAPDSLLVLMDNDNGKAPLPPTEWIRVFVK